MPKRKYHTIKGGKGASNRCTKEARLYARRRCSFQDGVERLISLKAAGKEWISEGLNSGIPTDVDDGPSFPSTDCNDPYSSSPEHIQYGLETMVETVEEDTNVFSICESVDEEEMDTSGQASHTSSSTTPKTNMPHCSKTLRNPHILMGIKLQQLCTDAQVPLHYYNDFLRLFKKYSKLSVEFDKVPARERLMKVLKKEIPCVQPTIVPVKLNSVDIVPKFNFLEQVKDLFATEYFQSPGNCCINPDETTRFGKYETPPEEKFSEMMSGEWYRQTYERFISEEGLTFTDPVTGKEYKNWLIPVILYNDKTGVSAMEGSYTLEPLMFTLGVIRRFLREKEDCWRHLGFIPTCSDSKTKANAEKSLQFTHECLQILLEELVSHQKTPPMIEVNIFGKLQHLRLKFEVAYVMGDQLSQDTHCCRKKINAGGAGRTHRGCLTSFLGAAAPPAKDGCHSLPKKVVDQFCT